MYMPHTRDTRDHMSHARSNACACRHVTHIQQLATYTLPAMTNMFHTCTASRHPHATTHRYWSDVRPSNTPAGSVVIWLLWRYLLRHTRAHAHTDSVRVVKRLPHVRRKFRVACTKSRNQRLDFSQLRSCKNTWFERVCNTESLKYILTKAPARLGATSPHGVRFHHAQTDVPGNILKPPPNQSVRERKFMPHMSQSWSEMFWVDHPQLFAFAWPNVHRFWPLDFCKPLDFGRSLDGCPYSSYGLLAWHTK
jgi:hypothetical protein